MYIHIYNHTSTLVTYLHYRVDSLSVHEVVLYGVLRDHLGSLKTLLRNTNLMRCDSYCISIGQSLWLVS